jgi:hypothetical protein
MKRPILLLCLCALFASSALAQKNRTPTCPADVTNLTATFANGADDSYRSDAVSPSYTTMKTKGDNIELMFQRANCSYDFTMNFHYSKRTTKLNLGGDIRDVEFANFDRVASVPLTLAANPSFIAFCDGNGDGVFDESPNVVRNADGTYKYDNYAGCGKDPDTVDASGNLVPGRYFVRRTVGMSAGLVSGTDYRFRFQNSPLDGHGTLAGGTSYIRVYHETGNTWEVSPEVTPIDSLGVLINGSTNTIEGYYRTPFRITVKSN